MPSLNVSIGGVTLPVSAESVATIKAFPDPGKTVLLELLAQAIASELEDAWATVVQDTRLFGREPVQDTFPEKPTPALLQQRKSSYPALYLHRHGKPKRERYTFAARRWRQTWALYYVLGELDAATAHKLSALMEPTIPAIVAATLQRGLHPGYDSGAVVFGEGTTSGILGADFMESDRIDVVGDGAGAIVGVVVLFETLESETRNVTFVPFDGALATFDLVAGGDAAGDPDLEDFLELDTTQ
jgi:hypothetical protein